MIFTCLILCATILMKRNIQNRVFLPVDTCEFRRRFVLKLHVIMGVTVHTGYMIKKLKEKRNVMVIVMDYDMSGNLELQDSNGAIYCSPTQTKAYMEKADRVLFHRYAFVFPKLNN